MKRKFAINTCVILGRLLLTLCCLNAQARDCDEYNYLNGLPEGYVLDKTKDCDQGAYRLSMVPTMDLVFAKKLKRPKPFEVLAQCPFPVYGVRFFAPVMHNDLRGVLTDSENEYPFLPGDVDEDFPDRTVFSVIGPPYPWDQPAVAWCLKTKKEWDQHTTNDAVASLKNIDHSSNSDLVKIFIPYQASFCVLEKNLFKFRPPKKDPRRVRFWCL